MMLMYFATVTCFCSLLSIGAASTQPPGNFGFGVELILAKLESLEARMMELEKLHHHLNNSMEALHSSCSRSAPPFRTQQADYGMRISDGPHLNDQRQLARDDPRRNTNNDPGTYYSYSRSENYTVSYDQNNSSSNPGRQFTDPFYQPYTPQRYPNNVGRQYRGNGGY